MSERKIKDKMTLKDIISFFANIVAIISFVITYFAEEKNFKLVAIIFIIVLDIFILIKNRELTKKNVELQQIKNNLTKQLEQTQKDLEELEKINIKSNAILQRIVDDTINGKVSSELMISYYTKERMSKFTNYIKMGVDVFISYIENEKLYDVTYCWEITGQNISCEELLAELNFLISGDSNIKNNDELNMQIEIEVNGKWRSINGNISGGDRIKLLNIQFGDYAVAPNEVFKVKFSYIWPHSYCAEGDKFSFGGNTFSSVNTSSMNIKIKASKECFNYAKLEVRENLDGGECRKNYRDIDIVEANGENVVTVSLPKCEVDRAIYIILTP